MTVCTVNGCNSTSEKDKKCSNITFHVFPSDPIIAARWIEIIRRNRNETCWKPTKNTKICSEHFDDKVKYTTKGGLCRLRRDAVPTKGVPVFSMEEKLNSDNLNDLQNSQERRRRDQLQPDYNLSTAMTMLSSRSISPLSSSSDSMFDTPKEASLRRQLKKKVLLQKRHTRMIKTLKEQNRRLKERNAILENILVNLPNNSNNDDC